VRICVVSREFPPITPYSGGIGVQFAGLTGELVRQDHSAVVVTVGDNGSERTIEHEGATAHVLPRPISDARWYMLERAAA
jgi:hypothetical protein